MSREKTKDENISENNEVGAGDSVSDFDKYREEMNSQISYLQDSISSLSGAIQKIGRSAVVPETAMDEVAIGTDAYFSETSEMLSKQISESL